MPVIMNEKPSYEELEELVRLLKQEVAMFKQIENLARVGYWEYNVESQKIIWSDGVYSIYGVDPETYDSSNVQKNISFYGPQDQPKIEAAFQRTVSKGEPYDLEITFTNAQGEHLWVRTIGKAEVQNGRVVRVYGHIMDITPSKSIEQELVKSEQWYRAVVEDQTEIISRFKADGKFTFVNEICCRLFGGSPKDYIGSRWQPVAHEEDVAMVEQKLKELSPQNPVITIENRVSGADGTLRWMQFVNRGFFDNQGRLIEIQSVGRDMTLLKEKERQLMEKEDEIRLSCNDSFRRQALMHHNRGLSFRYLAEIMESS